MWESTLQNVLQKKEDYHPLHEVYSYITRSTRNYGSKTHLNTSTAKLPVTSRVNPSHLKYIHMVEKYAYTRGVTDSLTNNANMVGWPSMLKVEFCSLIRYYGGVVFHNKLYEKHRKKKKP